MTTEKNLLVAGASGQLGRLVVELLLEAGEEHIIATTRTPEKLADLAEKGVTVRHADFSEPETLKTAFSGADRMLLISLDVLDVREELQKTAIQAAVNAGVSHIVYTSILEADDTPVFLAASHLATEQTLAASGIGYTILRNSIYTEMLLNTLGQAASMGGNIYSATEGGKTSWVTREDCARAASAALASDFDGKRILDVTGPEALSLAEVADIASGLGSQTFTYVPIPLDVLIENMVKAGLPQAVATGYASFDTATAQGKHSAVSNVVEELTGKKPTRVADFLAENAGAFTG